MEKNFKLIIYSTIAFCIIGFPTTFYLDYKQNNEPELKRFNYGIVRSAITFSTNGGIFGGELQTRITTDKKSIVIPGTPTVAIGDTLWLRYSKHRIFIITELGHRINIDTR